MSIVKDLLEERNLNLSLHSKPKLLRIAEHKELGYLGLFSYISSKTGDTEYYLTTHESEKDIKLFVKKWKGSARDVDEYHSRRDHYSYLFLANRHFNKALKDLDFKELDMMVFEL